MENNNNSYLVYLRNLVTNQENFFDASIIITSIIFCFFDIFILVFSQKYNDLISISFLCFFVSLVVVIFSFRRSIEYNRKSYYQFNKDKSVQSETIEFIVYSFVSLGLVLIGGLLIFTFFML